MYNKNNGDVFSKKLPLISKAAAAITNTFTAASDRILLL
jgi:hypothetical protein